MLLFISLPVLQAYSKGMVNVSLTRAPSRALKPCNSTVGTSTPSPQQGMLRDWKTRSACRGPSSKSRLKTDGRWRVSLAKLSGLWAPPCIPGRIVRAFFFSYFKSSERVLMKPPQQCSMCSTGMWGTWKHVSKHHQEKPKRSG